jgi:hydroxymethylpyrimidine pyrophosphatase-like HAD family hydrolase
VAQPTMTALRRLRAAGWRVLLVTGRMVDDLLGVFGEVGVCDLVVAENGALLFNPAAGWIKTLAPPPRPAFLEELRNRQVHFSVGRAVVATDAPYEERVRGAIRQLGLDLELAFNKGAVMVLPRGVDKRSGLQAALDELGLAPARVVGVGDGENDQPFLELCGRSVAVANSVPALLRKADLVTQGERGAGVQELVRRLLD